MRFLRSSYVRRFSGEGCPFSHGRLSPRSVPVLLLRGLNRAATPTPTRRAAPGRRRCAAHQCTAGARKGRRRPRLRSLFSDAPPASTPASPPSASLRESPLVPLAAGEILGVSPSPPYRAPQWRSALHEAQPEREPRTLPAAAPVPGHASTCGNPTAPGPTGASPPYPVKSGKAVGAEPTTPSVLLALSGTRRAPAASGTGPTAGLDQSQAHAPRLVAGNDASEKADSGEATEPTVRPGRGGETRHQNPEMGPWKTGAPHPRRYQKAAIGRGTKGHTPVCQTRNPV